MIGAKQFEPEALNKKAPRRKIKNPLLGMIKPKGEQKDKEEFKKLDADLDKIEKEGAKGYEPKEEYNPMPKPKLKSIKQKEKDKQTEDKEKVAKTRALSEDDINQISYKVFSSIRRYLDQGKDAPKENDKRIKIELSL